MNHGHLIFILPVLVVCACSDARSSHSATTAGSLHAGSGSSPSPNDQAAFDYFRGKGLSSVQAAGVVGNLDQESTVNPSAVQYDGGPGRGIAQWSVGGRWDTDANDNAVAYASSQGQDVWSLSLQLDFIWYELTTFSSYGLASLRASGDVASATIAFEMDFEGCGDCDQSQRIQYAQEVLAAYGSDAVDGGSAADSSVEGGSGGNGAGGGAGNGGGGGAGSGMGGSGSGGGGSDGVGKGGSGGGAGSGSSGGSGGNAGTGQGYAMIPSHAPARRHAVPMAEGRSETLSFVWTDAPGLAPAADLWIELQGRTLFQVASAGAHPFARSGLEVAPLRAGATYRLVIETTSESLRLTLLDTDGAAVLEASAAHASADRLEVVLPSTPFRQSIGLNLP